MSSPLTNGQKSYLAQLSDRAFNLLSAQARGRGEDPADTIGAALGDLRSILPSAISHLPFSELTPSAQRTAFRHQHAIQATGKKGLRCCSQDDYNRVKAHFLHLLGEDGRALNTLVRAETESRRVVSWKIITRCKQCSIPLTKAEGICRQMTKGQSGLQDADEKTLWNVFFKLRYYEPKKAA